MDFIHAVEILKDVSEIKNKYFTYVQLLSAKFAPYSMHIKTLSHVEVVTLVARLVMHASAIQQKKLKEELFLIGQHAPSTDGVDMQALVEAVRSSMGVQDNDTQAEILELHRRRDAREVLAQRFPSFHVKMTDRKVRQEDFGLHFTSESQALIKELTEGIRKKITANAKFRVFVPEVVVSFLVLKAFDPAHEATQLIAGPVLDRLNDIMVSDTLESVVNAHNVRTISLYHESRQLQQLGNYKQDVELMPPYFASVYFVAPAPPVVAATPVLGGKVFPSFLLENKEGLEVEHDSDDSAFDDDDDLADLAELAQLIDQPHRPSDKIHSRGPMASGLNDVPLRLGPSDIGTLKCLSSDGHLLGAGILATDTRIGDCATCGKIAYNSRPCKKCKRGCHATCLPGGICAGCVESTLEAELKPLMEIDPCVSCGEPCIGVAAMRCMQCNGRVHSASCSTEEMCNACYVSIAFTDPAVVAKPDPAVPQADALKRLRHVPPLEPGWEATIAPGQQLRGDVLTSYARALIQPHPDAVVVGGHTTSMMVSGVSMSMADLTRAKLVLFIVHDNALQHWSLAAWRTCTRTLWCYDSVPGCHREAQGRLGKWLSERYGIKLTVRRPACPAQHNSHDCGLFVLWLN